VLVCAWGGVSIDFGGGALHYFHRFMSWGGSQPADTDVSVQGEREELVSILARDSPSCRGPGGEAGSPAYGDTFRM